MATVGTCGNCGGPIDVPDTWMGICPPTPTCRSCGSTPKDAHGPKREMNPRPTRKNIFNKTDV